MLRATFILLVAALAVPAVLAAKGVSVEQLSREVSSLGKTKDAKAAGRLYDLQLTERLNSQKLAALEAKLPGPSARRALVALADQAVFLDPPPGEIPSRPPPSVAEQRVIIARSIDSAEAALHRLPNLYAQRDTIRYEDSPPGLQVRNSTSTSGTFMNYEPLHPVSRSVETVLYRKGREVVQKASDQQRKSTSPTSGMITFGEFGPIFSVLYGDLPKGNLRWGYWERGDAGLKAVFRFDVPKADSHYLVRYCCISGRVFQNFPAYRGELTLDPSTGTILRVTLIAELKDDPLTRSELMLEYAPVDLGGKEYVCPVRSISISRAPVQAAVRSAELAPWSVRPGGSLSDAPMQTMLNETVFDQYHLFRGDVQILTANDAQDESLPAAPENGSPVADASAPTTVASPGSTAANENETAETSHVNRPTPPDTSSTNGAAGPAPSAPNTQPVTPTGTSATAPGNASSSEASSHPEVAEVAPGPLPQMPVEPPSATGKAGFSLSLNSRRVDVDVTAVDKKGRPVTDLARKDFVIDDDGRKQSLRSFTRVTSSASPSTPLRRTTAQPVQYSNLPSAVGSGGADTPEASAPESSTIFLLDPTSLDFADLNYARKQILKFLDGLPQSVPVGLYVRTGQGFRILAEETTDPAALSSALRAWMPAAPDLSAAQEAEMRNRQQYDGIGSNAVDAGELASLNGNSVMPGSGLPTADPKLSQEGGVDPARATFGVLVGVAAHLNAIPGHKNLIWVASDNVLANWSDQTPAGDVSKDRIGGSGMRAQEALNDAHVSIYPLDASELETMATDASLQNNAIQLNAAAETLAPNANGAASQTGGRVQAEMQQDVRTIQPAVQHAAQATGGRAFPRAGNMIGELNSVVEAGDAAYLLSFAPDTPPDGKYHHITVTVPEKRGIKLRYRAGYLYTEEPTTLKARLQQAVWQPRDETGIGLTARWTHASEGAAISLSIAADDVSAKQQKGRWTDKLDIFLARLDATGTHANVTEKTLALNLTPATYQNLVGAGIPFAEYIDHPQATGTVRIIVVDENSGRMGSITLPATPTIANR